MVRFEDAVVPSRNQSGKANSIDQRSDLFVVPFIEENDGTPKNKKELALEEGVVAEQGLPMESVLQRVLSNGSVSAVFLNRNRIQELQEPCSHRLKMPQTPGDQKSSGRCWIYAMHNVMRKHLIEKLGLPPDFQLSSAYLAYYDLLEKSNLFLANVWSLRSQSVEQNTMLRCLLQEPVSDGGQWHMLQNLVRKYGVVPSSVMPETVHSGLTKHLNRAVNQILRARAFQMLNEPMKQKEIKTETVQKIRKLLTRFYGRVPDRQFVWRYTPSSKEHDSQKSPNQDERSTEERHIDPNYPWAPSPSLQTKMDVPRISVEAKSPQDFYLGTVLTAYPSLDLDEFVCLMNYPHESHPFDQWYTVKYLNNVVEGKESCFFNAPMVDLVTAVCNSIDCGEPVWFASDVSREASFSVNVLDPLITDQELVFDNAFERSLMRNKGDRMRFLGGSPDHAMVIKGYDKNGSEITKFLVENSWGTQKPSSDVIMSSAWFKEHVYNVAVHKRHVHFMKDRLSTFKCSQMEYWGPFGGLLD